MNILFIGGTGIISTAVSKLAVERGMNLFVLNRGKHNDVLPKEVHILQGDIYDEEGIATLLEGKYFDAIVQWIAFTVEHVERDVRLFKDHTDQYIFISSASAYQKPLPFLPITEEVPLDNPYWQYSKNKQLCEEYLLSHQSNKFHVTIIRPSHTYNEKMLISQLNSPSHPYTLLDRMYQNKPIIIPDEGMQLWTLTYNMDFAHAFLDVIGNPETYGEYYHITSDKVYTWERINEMIAEACGVTPNIIYIPWDVIFEHFPEWKPEILGDKQKSAVFDNSKIKSVAPSYKSETDYGDIVKQAVEYYRNNPELQTIDTTFNGRYDALIKAYDQED
ncbi:NAD-dependent epimerase/dehydratase family protein [Candidatus Xianfuyuplasma coldseepsis]|uniref:NAD-dependent epimerase/dehydratase family protein n=1 Tax=Candidatus Xianfuyuplasma coldseepsis TaxID=2782163 RepID=A0A7L7KSI5_9MOLU|nr:NAD-dependent epimerase/dehydratase family protein [Xianfuyuplasma coldseepsis]QMS85780.1 NAD-dependent epimerase/dehydratase family protein [Xianfuyuplasma coldseepsis]